MRRERGLWPRAPAPYALNVTDAGPGVFVDQNAGNHDGAAKRRVPARLHKVSGDLLGRRLASVTAGLRINGNKSVHCVFPFLVCPYL